MNNIDFSAYTFRCSSLPGLMTNSRSKSDLLSETAKAGLRELWIFEVYGREKFDTTNKYTEKGIMCEPDAFDLIKKVTNQTYFKNKLRLKNEFIEGEPDIVIDQNKPIGRIKDTKTSWSIWTFNNAIEESAIKSYYWQMLGYMWLFGVGFADILYCLVNTPEEIMNDELYKLSFRYPEMNESDEAMARFKKNYIFDDIPAKDRLKVYPVAFNPSDVELLKERVVAARAYLGTLSL